MLRMQMAGKSRWRREHIEWRSHEVSRVEAFTDAVFAFAITLLIVSLEVPENFDELMHGMQGFFPFAICFAMLFQVWMTQNIFFRRYGLQDSMTIVLNGMLVFVVLYFVYPLKFLFTSWLIGGFTFSDRHQIVTLFYIYGSGFLAIYLLFGLMYWHAWRQRDMLGLSAGEAFETRTHIYRNLLMASVGLLSILVASLGYRYTGFAGLVYMLIGPVIGITHSLRGKARRRKFGEEPTSLKSSG